MSRIGKKPVPLPNGVTANVDGKTVRVKGPKGELSLQAGATKWMRRVGEDGITVAPREGRGTRPLRCGACRARW